MPADSGKNLYLNKLGALPIFAQRKWDCPARNSAAGTRLHPHPRPGRLSGQVRKP